MNEWKEKVTARERFLSLIAGILVLIAVGLSLIGLGRIVDAMLGKDDMGQV